MFFVDVCYCGVDGKRRISADFAAAGQIEREPLSNQVPHGSTLVSSLLVSIGTEAGLARPTWIRRSYLVVFSLIPPAPRVLTPVISLPASNYTAMLQPSPEGSRPDGC